MEGLGHSTQDLADGLKMLERWNCRTEFQKLLGRLSNRSPERRQAPEPMQGIQAAVQYLETDQPKHLKLFERGKRLQRLHLKRAAP